MIPRFLGLVLVLGCDGGGRQVPADASPTHDAAFVAHGPFVPATVRFRTGEPVATFGACELGGTTVEYGARVVVDDCVECQCTTYGLRCRKRPACPDDRCVFVDGQVTPRGSVAIVDTCFECECGDLGPACRRRIAAPCPAAGCKLAGEELAVGSERFVSECHRCRCDADAGLICDNPCHPQCACFDGDIGCEQVCTEQTCPVIVEDQERIDLSCGSVVCDYGGLVGC